MRRRRRRLPPPTPPRFFAAYFQRRRACFAFASITLLRLFARLRAAIDVFRYAAAALFALLHFFIH